MKELDQKDFSNNNPATDSLSEEIIPENQGNLGLRQRDFSSKIKQYEYEKKRFFNGGDSRFFYQPISFADA